MAMSKEERAAYARGYAAGKKRVVRERSAEHVAARRNAFWQRAYLAFAPVAVTSPNWSIGDEKMDDSNKRIARLAVAWADAALGAATKQGRI
jgi:hypothetical protein